ncbi:type II toxin-antitoxin system VapC family toxin [Paractinoplanes hotanensis]|uniref:Type II toxin-antitoxin system VapC family toxin n=1 Tax=Paractinoplanes hotanensis TaxID=2906497 RepID=A0ABT0XUP2_9ACTN|nr:type II toxin-antitoxin system VapC family toxin [Actinoplanes hotanensis]MCM4077457.1 type II toxin-antitoxin system VapC family toxin [Actinoplanes hotanensis]
MRPSDPDSVYLESNALIYAVTKRPGYEPIAEVLRLAEERKLEVVISMLTYVEVRGWGLQDPYPVELDQEGVKLLDSPHLVRVELTRRVAIRAREIAVKYSLKNYDAIHLACASEYPAEVMMTWDKGFKGPRRVEGVWIDEPYELGGPRLF